MKKIVSTILILMMILSSTFVSASTLGITKKSTGKSIIKITTKEIKEKNQLLTSTIKLPIIQGMKNKTLEKKINETFIKNTNDFKNQIAKQAKEDVEYAKSQGYEFRPYEVFINYKVGHLGSIISLTMDYYSYTGGAHGATTKVGYNFDTTTGKNLILKDLFKPGADFKKVIKTIIKNNIKANSGIYFSDAAKTIDNIPDNQPFYIKDGELIVYYGQYEIAPYASGIREFKIPYSTIKGMVRDNFKSNF